jgi:glutaredoxin 3
MHIEIYSKDNCPHCVRAKHAAQAYAQENAVSIAEYNMSNDAVGIAYKEKLLMEVPNARSVPQVFVDGKHIGGADQFIEWIELKKSNILLG